ADMDIFRLESNNGSVVAAVQDGPAKQAGVQLGDVIVAVDGQSIRDTPDLQERIALRQPGERVVLDIVRYGDRKRVAVTLGQFQSEPSAAPTAAAPSRDEVAQLGFAAAELTPAMAQRMGFQAAGGVVITQIEPGGPAPSNLRGLKVERLNGREISSIDDLQAAAADLGPGTTVSIIGTPPNGERMIVNYRIR
ncbi:MAG TPA: PDZ domain-containing protein, partial [Longimicrobiaceae bacterium]|nr:PDZ domain-containing protein [Longimicrobiaceae bacterium]